MIQSFPRIYISENVFRTCDFELIAIYAQLDRVQRRVNIVCKSKFIANVNARDFYARGVSETGKTADHFMYT